MAPKRTATGGMATGKRNKMGRKRRKEAERLEYLDHQKRRLDNYIKAEVIIITLSYWSILSFIGGKTK